MSSYDYAPGYAPPYPASATQGYPSAGPPPPPQVFGGGYQGYFDEGYPPPPPRPLPAYEHYHSNDSFRFPFLRSCLAALCCCCFMERCCDDCY